MMSLLGSDSMMSVDVTASPSTSMQCIEDSSPVASSIKSLYSKLLTSCKQGDRLSNILTPENKASMTVRMGSSLVQGHGPFNPFNQNLRERLENPIFSPNVFSTVISPSQDSNEFKWTIEDLSKINPVPIEEEFHFEEQIDEQTETEMQRTIDKYFTKTHMVPSPWDSRLPTNWNSFTEVFKKDKQNILLNEHVNSNVCSSPYPYSVSRLNFVSRTPSQNASTQTALSLPPDLPENLNSLLKPYFSDSSLDEMNSSMNSSLRRKLFFQKDDHALSPVSLFRVNDDSPLISSCCPSSIKLRTDGSPFEHFSPLDLSPIGYVDKKPACNNPATPVHVIVEDPDEKKENIDPARNDVRQYYGECYKVFESPKLTTGIRRNRKRRRSVSQDIDMSLSYSHFTSKHNSTEQTALKFCVCPEESQMCVDTFSENAVESEDTGYGTSSACTTSFEKFSTKNDSNLKLTFHSWMNKFKDKTNALMASTPTKNQ